MDIFEQYFDYSEELKFSCQICSKAFKTEKQLIKHMKSHESSTEEYICQHPNCHQIFTSKSNYERHLQTHIQDKQFECPKCNKKFLTKWNLKSHLKTHLAKENRVKFNCSICKKSFLDKRTLQKHINKKHYNNLQQKTNSLVSDNLTLASLNQTQRTDSSQSLTQIGYNPSTIKPNQIDTMTVQHYNIYDNTFNPYEMEFQDMTELEQFNHIFF